MIIIEGTIRANINMLKYLWMTELGVDFEILCILGPKATLIILSIFSSLYYFHSYAVILNILDSGSNSDSSAIIKLFIQDNFCEFVNPVTMINPLTFLPSTTLPFP